MKTPEQPRQSIPVEEYLQGTPRVPRLLVADAYTIGTGPHASNDAKYKSVYHITPRRGFAEYLPAKFLADGRIIFAGLRRILRDLLTERVTMHEIEEADRFLATAHAGGTQYYWDRDLWVRVVKECKGIIPVKIEAFEEGVTSFGSEPTIQITSKEGYGELAGYFESKLMHVWSSSERATSLKWAQEYLKRLCCELHPSWTEQQVENAVSTMIHDFGDRGHSCAQESEVLGQAHQLVFPGTDTFASTYLDWKENGEYPYGCSIHALAHRTVMAYMQENDCHAALYRLGKVTGITAHVSDTYDYFNQVTWFGEMLTSEWAEDDNLIVARPDSGNMKKCTLHVLQTCNDFGLFEEDPDTKIRMATRLRWIQGDSVTWDTMIQLVEAVIEFGWSPFASGAFGIGGHLRNSISRSHSGTSKKLAAVGNGNRPTVKRSETPAKSSIPGIVKVIDNGSNRDRSTVYDVTETIIGENLLKVWYDGTTTTSLRSAFYGPALETSSVVRERIKNNFMRRKQPRMPISNKLNGMRRQLIDMNVKTRTIRN